MHACAHALCPCDDADGDGEGHRGEEHEAVDEGGGDGEEGDWEDERTAHQHENSRGGCSRVHLAGGGVEAIEGEVNEGTGREEIRGHAEAREGLLNSEFS